GGGAAQTAPARALQGQGREVRRGNHSPQAGQDGSRVNMSASTIIKKHELRTRRKAHIRKKVEGSPDRPRLSVYRSLNHIYAQVIDDLSGKTIAAASTLSPELKDAKGKKKDVAKQVGELVAK